MRTTVHQTYEDFVRYREDLRSDPEQAESVVDLLDEYAQRYFWLLGLLSGDDGDPNHSKKMFAFGAALACTR